MLKWSLFLGVLDVKIYVKMVSFFRCFLLILNTREKTLLHESVTKSSLARTLSSSVLVSPTDTVILSLAR